MIEEMRKENLLLLTHIIKDSKSTLDYNIFLINKFLVKKSNSYWWNRLLVDDEDYWAHTSTTKHTNIKAERTKHRLHSLCQRMKQRINKLCSKLCILKFNSN